MIAIQHTASYYFSARWIEYCNVHNIPYKIVDVYRSDIIDQLKGCSAFMWHWDHESPVDHLFARQLIMSIEKMGLKVFPNSDTCWHFDDKVGQSYLFDALNIPTPKNRVFYRRNDALAWAEKQQFPVVAKLRGGAGSSNVRLIKNRREAVRYINKCFKKGFSPCGKLSILRDTFSKWKKHKVKLRTMLGAIRLQFITTKFERNFPRQVGYAYFQEFIPNNDGDIRVVVSGNERAFALVRKVRNGDFRASGSGNILYDTTLIPEQCIKTAFEVAQKTNSQSAALDFVFDDHRQPLLVEMSYGYAQAAYDKCEGYWDKNLIFHKEPIHPQWWMVEMMLK